MSINKPKRHILVVPEDMQIVRLQMSSFLILLLMRLPFQLMPLNGGWTKVVEKFKNDYINSLRRFHERRIVLIVDFDNSKSRLLQIRNDIPEDLIDRVFILGVQSEPEDLKRELGRHLEDIGKSLSQDCYDNTRTAWGHAVLRNNENELDRMVSSVRPFLFP